MARTVDNLGIETSIRYADDQKNLDPALIRDASTAAKQTVVDTITPTYEELTRLFEMDRRGAPYATFTAPPKFQDQKGRLFTNQIIPYFGNPEKKEMQIERILGTADSATDKVAWKTESESLVKLINELDTLDDWLQEVTNSRTQLQKG